MSRAAHKLPASYPAMLKDIKSRIRDARIALATAGQQQIINHLHRRCLRASVWVCG